jgi:hypothetical protein
MFGVECHAYANDFQRVREEDRGHPSHAAGYEPSTGGFVGSGGDDPSSNLFIGKEFDAGIGKDAQEGCGMAAKETAKPICFVDVPHGSCNPEPMTRIFGELRVGGLEKDLDTV